MRPGVVAQLVPTASDGRGHGRVGVEPGTHGHHRDLGAAGGQCGEHRSGDSGIALAVKGECDLLAVPRPVLYLGGRPGRPRRRRRVR